MARLEGFEPPTNRIGTCYSIQLSYRRVIEVFADSNVTDLRAVCKQIAQILGSAGRLPPGTP